MTYIQTINTDKWKSHYPEEQIRYRDEYINQSPKSYNLPGAIVSQKKELVNNGINSIKKDLIDQKKSLQKTDPKLTKS